MNCKCKLNISYPRIEVTEKNLKYANLLLNDFAGPFSEMTAINQYFYQHLIVDKEHKDIAEALECISMVEMHHLEMLGEIIVLLGGNPLPRIENGRNSRYWIGCDISPTQNIKKFLIENIKAEEGAIKAYKRRIAQIKDPKIVTILERIIMDEEHHLGIFQKFLDECHV